MNKKIINLEGMVLDTIECGSGLLLVNDKYIYITNLKPKVANFDELTLEIDQLNDEIENN